VVVDKLPSSLPRQQLLIIEERIKVEKIHAGKRGHQILLVIWRTKEKGCGASPLRNGSAEPVARAILARSVWPQQADDGQEAVGGFDLPCEIYYDGFYSAAHIFQGLPPILSIPNTLVLNPHNQSQFYDDPFAGLHKVVIAALVEKYGKRSGDSWRDKGCPL
jgi:hypothetical protein